MQFYATQNLGWAVCQYRSCLLYNEWVNTTISYHKKNWKAIEKSSTLSYHNTCVLSSIYLMILSIWGISLSYLTSNPNTCVLSSIYLMILSIWGIYLSYLTSNPITCVLSSIYLIILSIWGISLSNLTSNSITMALHTFLRT